VRAAGDGAADQTATIAVTITAPASGFTLAVSPAARTLQASTSTSLTISVTRTGGFDGAVTLSAEGIPAGITPTFNPKALTTSLAALALASTAATPRGTFPITVRGTASGGLTSSATFQLTVIDPTGGVSLAANPSALSAQSGGGIVAVQSTITIVRSGTFTGSLSFSATGLPSGVTYSISPISTTGPSVVLTLNVGSVAPGTYPITITGEGIYSATTTVTLTVTPAPIIWNFAACEVPLWLAFRDGPTGAWTRILPTGSTFTLPITQATGTVAYVERQESAAAPKRVYLFDMTAQELRARGTQLCAVSPDYSRNLSGTVAGLSAGDQVQVSFGGRTTALAHPATTYTITNAVRNEPQNLVAARGRVEDGALVLNSLILRRGLNPPHNGTLAVLDFGSAEPFMPAVATYTFGNVGADALTVGTVVAGSGEITYGPLAGGTAVRQAYGVPPARLLDSELNIVRAVATSVSGSATRQVSHHVRSLVPITLDTDGRAWLRRGLGADDRRAGDMAAAEPVRGLVSGGRWDGVPRGTPDRTHHPVTGVTSRRAAGVIPTSRAFRRNSAP
jgi:hypothetical protein